MESNFKGTKGEWSVGDHYFNEHGVKVLKIDSDGVEELASVYIPDFCGDDDLEYIANANVIAAAPVLLEALEKVYRLAKQIGLAEDLDFEEIDYIGKAINKAKGV